MYKKQNRLKNSGTCPDVSLGLKTSELLVKPELLDLLVFKTTRTLTSLIFSTPVLGFLKNRLNLMNNKIYKGTKRSKSEDINQCKATSANLLPLRT